MTKLPVKSFIRVLSLNEAATKRAMESVKANISKKLDTYKLPEQTYLRIFALIKQELEEVENDYDFPKIYNYMSYINKLASTYQDIISLAYDLSEDINHMVDDITDAYTVSATEVAIFVKVLTTAEYTALRKVIYDNLNIPKGNKIDINTIPIEYFKAAIAGILEYCKVEDKYMYSSVTVLQGLKNSINIKPPEERNNFRQNVDEYLKDWSKAQYVTFAEYNGYEIIQPINKVSYLICGYGTLWCNSIPTVLNSGMLATKNIKVAEIVSAGDLLEKLVNVASNYPNEFIIIKDNKSLYQFGIPTGLWNHGDFKMLIKSGQNWFNDTQDEEVFSTPKVSESGHGQCLIIDPKMPKDLIELFKIFAKSFNLTVVFSDEEAMKIDDKYRGRLEN